MDTGPTSLAKAAHSDNLRSCSVILSVNSRNVLRAFEAKTFLSRLRGLHAFLPLADDEALIISPCNSIHTMTMRMPIDVVFLNGEGIILEVDTLKQRRLRAVSKAAVVIELNAGVGRRLGMQAGMRIDRDTGEWA